MNPGLPYVHQMDEIMYGEDVESAMHHVPCRQGYLSMEAQLWYGPAFLLQLAQSLFS